MYAYVSALTVYMWSIQEYEIKTAMQFHNLDMLWSTVVELEGGQIAIKRK